MVTRRKCPTAEHAYVEMASRSAIFCSKCGDIRETKVERLVTVPAPYEPSPSWPVRVSMTNT
jgi:hypothetical protein